MNYKFLAKKEVESIFEDTKYSVGEVMRILTSERFTGIQIKDKSVLNKTDEEWHEAFEKAYKYEQE